MPLLLRVFRSFYRHLNYGGGITVDRPQKPRENVHSPDLTDLAECKDRMEEENMNK